MRLQELESSIAKKECYIKELETSLSEQKEASNRQYGEVNLLNERLNNEARKVKSLERENDRLRSEISLLESKVGSNNILRIMHIIIFLGAATIDTYKKALGFFLAFLSSLSFH